MKTAEAETQKTEPDRLETLLSDLEGKYKKPDPGNIALGTQRFEHIVNGVIVPFIGLNAFLIGGIVLHRLYPQRFVALFLCNLLAATLVLGWMYLHRHQPNPFPVLFFSAVPTFLLAAFLSIPVPSVALLLVLTVTYGFASFVYAIKIRQTAVPLYVIYLPILLSNLQSDQGYRIAIELLTLIPMGVLFLIRRFPVATTAVVVSAVITASVESPETEIPGLVLLSLLLVGLGIWYETRIPKTDYSPLRTLLDQGLLVLLIFFALATHVFKSSDTLAWTWASAVTLYQAVQCWREKFGYPTRIAVAAICLTVALWVTDTPLPGSLPIAGALLIAALTNLAALRLGSSLLSNVSVLLMVPGAWKIYDMGIVALSATVAVMGLLTTAALLLIARTPQFVAPRPWWRGFIQQKHLEWVQNFLLMAGGTLLKFPLATFLFNIFRSCFVWLRYFKGKTKHFGLDDLFYAAAHVYGVTILSHQAQLLAATRNSSVNVQLTVATAVWVLWGLAVFSMGIHSRTIYQRFIGLAFMISPCVLYYPSMKDGDAALALVSMVAGGAFLLVGFLKEISHEPVSEETTDPSDEDSHVNEFDSQALPPAAAVPNRS